MARLITLTAVLLSLAVGVGPAAAKTWTSGQTAAYTVHVPHGPAYRVEFEVPRGMTAEVADGLIMRRRGCTSGAPGDASLEGKTFARALRDPIKGRRTGAGPG